MIMIKDAAAPPPSPRTRSDDKVDDFSFGGALKKISANGYPSHKMMLSVDLLDTKSFIVYLYARVQVIVARDPKFLLGARPHPDQFGHVPSMVGIAGRLPAERFKATRSVFRGKGASPPPRPSSHAPLVELAQALH